MVSASVGEELSSILKPQDTLIRTDISSIEEESSDSSSTLGDESTKTEKYMRESISFDRITLPSVTAANIKQQEQLKLAQTKELNVSKDPEKKENIEKDKKENSEKTEITEKKDNKKDTKESDNKRDYSSDKKQPHSPKKENNDKKSPKGREPKREDRKLSLEKNRQGKGQH